MIILCPVTRDCQCSSVLDQTDNRAMRYILVSLTTKLFSFSYLPYICIGFKNCPWRCAILKCVTKIAGYNGHKKSKCNVGQCWNNVLWERRPCWLWKDNAMSLKVIEFILMLFRRSLLWSDPRNIIVFRKCFCRT